MTSLASTAGQAPRVPPSASAAGMARLSSPNETSGGAIQAPAKAAATTRDDGPLRETPRSRSHSSTTAHAKAATAAGAARVLPSQPLEVDDLVAALEELAENPDRLVKMSEAQASLARPDAAEEIVAACTAWTEESR